MFGKFGKDFTRTVGKLFGKRKNCSFNGSKSRVVFNNLSDVFFFALFCVFFFVF